MKKILQYFKNSKNFVDFKLQVILKYNNIIITCWSSSHPEVHSEFGQQFHYLDLRFWQTAVEIHLVRLGLCVYDFKVFTTQNLQNELWTKAIFFFFKMV